MPVSMASTLKDLSASEHRLFTHDLHYVYLFYIQHILIYLPLSILHPKIRASFLEADKICYEI